MVKHELMESASRAELALIVVPLKKVKTGLKWEHEREFEYRGQMYDVVEREVRGDSAYYWCWWDQEETALNRQLEDCVARLFTKHPRSKQEQQRLIRFYQSLICTEHTTPPIFKSLNYKHYPAYISPYYAEPSYRPLSPPPDVLLV